MDNDDNNGGVQLSQLSDAEVNGYSEQIKNYIKNADNNGDINYQEYFRANILCRSKHTREHQANCLSDSENSLWRS